METTARITLEAFVIPGGIVFLLICLYQFSRSKPQIKANLIRTEPPKERAETAPQRPTHELQVHLAIRVLAPALRSDGLSRGRLTSRYQKAIRSEALDV